MSDLSNVSVVLPSLDPDEKLTQVIDGLLEYGFSDIVLVNDGSKPENLHYFEDAARLHPEIHLLTHEVNRGKGAALKTAFTYVLSNRPESRGVVTVDGDNQHHPADTRACAEAMLSSGHAVLGCRDFTLPDVPPRSRFGNHTTSLVFKIFCGMTISDTQTGLRAIPIKYLPTLNEVYGDRFEYETNMLLAFKNEGIPFDEGVPQEGYSYRLTLEKPAPEPAQSGNGCRIEILYRDESRPAGPVFLNSQLPGRHDGRRACSPIMGHRHLAGRAVRHSRLHLLELFKFPVKGFEVSLETGSRSSFILSINAEEISPAVSSGLRRRYGRHGHSQSDDEDCKQKAPES